jgi:hypothetical protein
VVVGAMYVYDSAWRNQARSMAGTIRLPALIEPIPNMNEDDHIKEKIDAESDSNRAAVANLISPKQKARWSNSGSGCPTATTSGFGLPSPRRNPSAHFVIRGGGTFGEWAISQFGKIATL